MPPCIFCSIIEKKAPARFVYEDETAVAFYTINPVAPVHLLIVPRKYIASVNMVEPEDEALLGHMFSVARQLADEAGVAHSGYRLITNTGPDGGQSVYHIHLHLIGGKHLPFRFE